MNAAPDAAAAPSRPTRTLFRPVGFVVLASLSFSAWWYLEMAFDGGDLSWVKAATVFSLVAVMLCLIALTEEKHPKLRLAAAALSLGPAFFFVPDWRLLPILVLSFVCVWYGLVRVAREIEARIRIAIGRSLGAGLPLILLGFCLAIVTQYYFHINALPWTELLPRFNLGQQSNALLIRTLESTHPGFQQAGEDGLTLDAFLLALQDTVAPNSTLPPVSVPPEVEALLPPELRSPEALAALEREAYLRAGRERFATLSGGGEFSGAERVTDVLTGILNYQTRIFFDPEARHYPPVLLPFLLCLLLFLTIFPLGTLLGLLWIAVAALGFRLLRRLKVVRVERRNVEQETIVY